MGGCTYRAIREALVIKLSFEQEPEVKGGNGYPREREEGAQRLGARPH